MHSVPDNGTITYVIRLSICVGHKVSNTPRAAKPHNAQATHPPRVVQLKASRGLNPIGLTPQKAGQSSVAVHHCRMKSRSAFHSYFAQHARTRRSLEESPN